MDVPQAGVVGIFLVRDLDGLPLGGEIVVGLRQFLDEKSYKPTFEPFKLGTLLTDQRSAKK
jgi:hypothetical protein